MPFAKKADPKSGLVVDFDLSCRESIDPLLPGKRKTRLLALILGVLSTVLFLRRFHHGLRPISVLL